jgi:hypothetical protein
LDIGGSHDKRPGTEKEKWFRIHETLNIAAWNVRSIGNKEYELVKVIKVSKTYLLAPWSRVLLEKLTSCRS